MRLLTKYRSFLIGSRSPFQTLVYQFEIHRAQFVTYSHKFQKNLYFLILNENIAYCLLLQKALHGVHPVTKI